MSSPLTPGVLSRSGKVPEWGDPVTGEALRPFRDSEGKPHLVSSTSRYPIVSGIPRILPEASSYATAFGEQWNRWRLTQLDSHTGIPISRDRLWRCLGPEVVGRLLDATQPTDVLEVGCGAGRFTEILLSFPATRVTSMDISSAVEANRLNFPVTERHRVVQADIEHPPFAHGEYFNVVVCLGVVQHTPSPEQTIQRLYGLVSPGGTLIFDHYRPEWRRLTKVTALALRPLVKRLPYKQRVRLCEHLVTTLLPFHKAVRNLRWAQYALSRLSPITTYYHVYPMLPEHIQREWAVLDTHDGLADWYKHLRTGDQLADTLRQVGAKDVNIAISSHGAEVRCLKPVPS